MMYSSGREVPVDLITAHKWFNIAAMKGHAEAAQLRREIAAEMQDAEIGQAQRAARDWLKAHPEPVVPQPRFCAPRPERKFRRSTFAAGRALSGGGRGVRPRCFFAAFAVNV